jgi:hypothetical protein
LGALNRSLLLTAVAFFALLAFAAPRAQATSRILPFPNPLATLAAVADLKYYGGPVMPYAENKQVVWGASVDAPSADWLSTFFTAVAAAGSASPYDVDLQYGTQGITPEGGASSPNLPLTNDSTYLGSTQITPSLTTCGTTVSRCTVTDAQVRAELKAQIGAGVLPAPQSAFGAPVTHY